MQRARTDRLRHQLDTETKAGRLDNDPRSYAGQQRLVPHDFNRKWRCGARLADEEKTKEESVKRSPTWRRVQAYGAGPARRLTPRDSFSPERQFSPPVER